MLIRCATPVSRNRSQSSRSMAAWSPTARAASTPADWASGTRNRIASRTAWRARPTGWPAASASLRLTAPAVARTVPLARKPCSNIHSSRSKPPGLSVPCGWRSLAVSSQRWPARSSCAGAASSASPSKPRYQPSETRSGTFTGWPSSRACSTCRTKRVPCGPGWGRPLITPVSCRSRPSRTVGSVWASRWPARQPVLPNPVRASARHRQASEAALPGARRPAVHQAPASSSAANSRAW
ncbi:MAG: hypothetical protein H6R06_1512 [Proteobacteria bacterium]|jgi:hypothetical protein|nr:hypothetical protein [Pseudomonadota bacterium]